MKEQLIYLHGLFGDENEFSTTSFSQIPHIQHIYFNLPDAQVLFPDYLKVIHQILSANKKVKKHLVGFSMGGRIAFHLKAMFPDSYDKVVLIGAQAVNFEPDDRLQIDQNRLSGINNKNDFAEWMKAFFNAPLYGKLYNHPSFQDKKNRIQFSKINRYQHFFDYLSVTRQPTLLPNKLQKLKNIFYLYGEYDEKYKGIGMKLKNMVSSLQTFSIPHSHHAAHIENPEAVQRILKEIFSEPL